MKKIIITACAFVAFSAIVFSSCKKATDCVSLVTKASTASSAFASDQSVANCTAYKTAMQAWLASDCSKDDATSKAAFTASIAALPCQ
jgi:hypothetical protein